MRRTHRRPDPDALLAQRAGGGGAPGAGKLKIFLGYAAGVGKTYAMLEAAHQRQGEGVDVVIGYVETHGRAETEALLAGLEVIPRRQISYHGAVLTEMDVDAVLARRPQLVLVDELAHTNAPGSRHPKRYQDVEELLDAGIDVYTTLNIQHLESLNDVVAQITGVTVRETVPDRVLDEANEIEVVDLPPHELLQRLKEGKVYVPDQAARAIQQFFRKGNLTALREMTLRRAAERVDDQMRAYMQTRAIPGPWPAGERLLVCISPSPLSERLVRTARRLADELNAEWFAVHVEGPGETRLSRDREDHVARTLRLAEELGAKTIMLPGLNVADSDPRIRPPTQHHQDHRRQAAAPALDGMVARQRGGSADRAQRRHRRLCHQRRGGSRAGGHTSSWRPHRPWQRYLWSMVLVGAVTLLSVRSTASSRRPTW